MKIVPIVVSVFVVAFHDSSPDVWPLFQTIVCPDTCVAAVLPLAPRVTVQVVVPKPPVTFMYSSSIRIWNCEVGKPAADGTLSVVCAAVIAAPSVVLAPGPTRQVYEVEGVRSKTVETLLSRVVLLSKVGVVPLAVVQAVLGPGIAFWYHVAKSAVGGGTTGGVWLTAIVVPSESLL